MLKITDDIDQSLTIELTTINGIIVAIPHSNKMGISSSGVWDEDLYESTTISFEIPVGQANWKEIYRSLRLLFSPVDILYLTEDYPFKMPPDVARRIFGGETLFVPKGTFKAGSGS